MKKLTLLALFCAFATAASAQFVLGGQFNFSSIKEKNEAGGSTNENTTTLVSLIPRLAFASGDLWYGIDAGVSLINEKDDIGGTTEETKATIASVAPFIRYTKRPVDNFGIWIEGQAGASFGSQEFEGRKTAKYSGFNVGVRPGVIFFIGDHLSFEASFGRLGFTSFTSTDPDNSNNKNTVSQVGLMLNNNSLFLDETLFNISSGFQFGANWMF